VVTEDEAVPGVVVGDEEPACAQIGDSDSAAPTRRSGVDGDGLVGLLDDPATVVDNLDEPSTVVVVLDQDASSGRDVFEVDAHCVPRGHRDLESTGLGEITRRCRLARPGEGLVALAR
jgi:hypothetical protein